jgi:hypothetical protein
LAGKIMPRVRAIGRSPGSGPSAGSGSATAFAAFNGTAPIEVSSGDVVRHRLSRAGTGN